MVRTNTFGRQPILWLVLSLWSALLLTFLGWRSIDAPRPPLLPLGGRLFSQTILLPVPYFSQGDFRWADDPLDNGPESMAQAGCAVSAASMVLAYYGVRTDPGELNRFLIDHQGFVGAGWIRWEQVCQIPEARGLVFAYEGPPDYYLIDENLRCLNPVIIRLRLPNHVPHFVVIVGKTGRDYLVADPSPRGLLGPYPLAELGSRMEALRYYRKPGTAFPVPARLREWMMLRF